jgi:DNA-binding NtrC family response regulator
MIEDALRETAGNKQKAAQALGLSRQGLIKKLKRLGIGV